MDGAFPARECAIHWEQLLGQDEKRQAQNATGGRSRLRALFAGGGEDLARRSGGGQPAADQADDQRDPLRQDHGVPDKTAARHGLTVTGDGYEERLIDEIAAEDREEQRIEVKLRIG